MKNITQSGCKARISPVLDLRRFKCRSRSRSALPRGLSHGLRHATAEAKARTRRQPDSSRPHAPPPSRCDFASDPIPIGGRLPQPDHDAACPSRGRPYAFGIGKVALLAQITNGRWPPSGLLRCVATGPLRRGYLARIEELSRLMLK